MFCDFDHDDIQYWLMQKENRTKILKDLRLKVDKRILYPMMTSVKIEERFKPNYEPEIFIDLLETRFLSERSVHKKIYVKFKRTAESVPIPDNIDEVPPVHENLFFNTSQWKYEGEIVHAVDEIRYEVQKTGSYFTKWFVDSETKRYDWSSLSNSYQALQFLFESRWLDGRNNVAINKTKRLEYRLVWEIKPFLDDLGQTLRQLMKYKDIVKPNHIILVYSSAKAKDQLISTYFANQEVYTYRLLPTECKHLEEYLEK